VVDSRILISYSILLYVCYDEKSNFRYGLVGSTVDVVSLRSFRADRREQVRYGIFCFYGSLSVTWMLLWAFRTVSYSRLSAEDSIELAHLYFFHRLFSKSGLCSVTSVDFHSFPTYLESYAFPPGAFFGFSIYVRCKFSLSLLVRSVGLTAFLNDAPHKSF
jgi:hypothetical protein